MMGNCFNLEVPATTPGGLGQKFKGNLNTSELDYVKIELLNLLRSKPNKLSITFSPTFSTFNLRSSQEIPDFEKFMIM